MNTPTQNESIELLAQLFKPHVSLNELAKMLKIEEQTLKDLKSELLVFTTNLIDEKLKKSSSLNRKTRTIHDVKKTNDFLMKVLK